MSERGSVNCEDLAPFNMAPHAAEHTLIIGLLTGIHPHVLKELAQ